MSSILRKFRRVASLRRTLFILISISVLLVVHFHYKFFNESNSLSQYKSVQPYAQLSRQCPSIIKSSEKLKRKVLLLSIDRSRCDKIRNFIETVKYEFIQVSKFDENSLFDHDFPQFASVIFCSFQDHNEISTYQSFYAALQSYQSKHSIGKIIIANQTDERLYSIPHVTTSYTEEIGEASFLIHDSSLLRITKAHKEHFALSFHKGNFQIDVEDGVSHEKVTQLTISDQWRTGVVHVCQQKTEPETIIFGMGTELFVNQMLLLDSIYYTSKGILQKPLEKNIQIDIDDIFVGEPGTRIGVSDVDAMIEFTDKWKEQIPGFNFVVGFSGKFINRGNETEDAGDSYILEKKDHFRWFGHMFSHMKAIMFEDDESLCKYMSDNKKFGVKNQLPFETGYAVAPHHAGVYPVHEPLYHCWREVWGVKITSTEEYPHLYPATKRRGFLHQGLQVLPRQTCRLFTHTQFYKKFPNGPNSLEASIHGGELFSQLLLNEMNIFMTHMQNYGGDRLSLYTFGKAFEFLYKMTNLRLVQLPTQQLADKYFKNNPKEADTPTWTNPCNDKRHLEIVPESRKDKCQNLPDFVIVGPQKTGTTALMNFLKHHPTFLSSYDSPTTYEELQFFSSQNYKNGLNWYLDLFPDRPSDRKTLIFEKSATYFTSSPTIPRIKALLPKIKIVSVLMEPGARAYSWYFHQKAHNIPAAVKYSFMEVLNGKEGDDSQLLDLQNRCLAPGNYAKHLAKWISAFESNVVIVDGDKLKADPIAAMNDFQHDIIAPSFVDYSKLISFDEQKGFFCPLENGKTRCLGISKGRKYPDMPEECRKTIDEFYAPLNENLKDLLLKNELSFPTWLK